MKESMERFEKYPENKKIYTYVSKIILNGPFKTKSQ